jgi:hypothetical protein
VDLGLSHFIFVYLHFVSCGLYRSQLGARTSGGAEKS